MNTQDIKRKQTTRSIFLGDIENLAWDKQANTLTLPSIRTISDAVSIKLQEYSPLEVLASSHYFAKQIWFAWGRTTRRLLGSGPDGADKALLDLVNNEKLHERFDTVIIGSGDGIFTKVATELASRKVHVIAAYGNGRLSKELQLAVHETIELTTLNQQTQAA